MAPRPSLEKRELQYPKDLADPKDWLNFVQLGTFERAWKKLGLTDDDLRAIEMSIMLDPTRPPVIAGTDGLRKLRCTIEREQLGTRSGLRCCFVYFEEFGLIALVTVYKKNRKDDLTAEECKAISKLIKSIRDYLAGAKD